MVDLNAVKIEPHFNFKSSKAGRKEQGGQGGTILIFSEKIKGSGKISADGGDGQTGGSGGSIRIIAKDNNFRGKISAKGGKSRG